LNISDPFETIRIENVKIGYPAVYGESAFTRDIDGFSASAGEMVALIGPNGIGKSTLMRTMAGLQKILSGDIRISHKSIVHYAAAELAKTISFVSTENIQIANMKVADLVAYGRFPYTGWLGTLLPEDTKKVMEAMKMTGLLPLSGKMINQISDGERQRAMIARALAQDTPVIILDEPTAFLDISNKYEIFSLLHDLTRQYRKTVILSTHDLNIALREADKLWIMLENETFQGAPEDAALHGWLDRLFREDRIGFNAEEGDFFFRKKQNGRVKVTGEGLPCKLTIRALERKGFQTNPEDQPVDFTVSIISKSNGEIEWQLHKGNEESSFNSIYSLLAGV
jgi:iron complex transport system ATP-binding protein